MAQWHKFAKYQLSQPDRLMKHHIKLIIAICFRQKSATLQKSPHAPSNKTKENKTELLILVLHSCLWRSPSKPSWEVTQVSETQSIGIQLPAPFEYLYDNFAAKVGDIFLSEVDATAVQTVFPDSHCKYSTIISILLMMGSRLYEPTP